MYLSSLSNLNNTSADSSGLNSFNSANIFCVVSKHILFVISLVISVSSGPGLYTSTRISGFSSAMHLNSMCPPALPAEYRDKPAIGWTANRLDMKIIDFLEAFNSETNQEEIRTFEVSVRLKYFCKCLASTQAEIGFETSPRAPAFANSITVVNCPGVWLKSIRNCSMKALISSCSLKSKESKCVLTSLYIALQFVAVFSSPALSRPTSPKSILGTRRLMPHSLHTCKLIALPNPLLAPVTIQSRDALSATLLVMRVFNMRTIWENGVLK